MSGGSGGVGVWLVGGGDGEGTTGGGCEGGGAGCEEEG